MINWKTTLPGLITAIVNLFLLFACKLIQIICLTGEQTTMLIGSVTTIGLTFVAICAKDKDVSGGSKPQTPEAEKRIKLV